MPLLSNPLKSLILHKSDDLSLWSVFHKQYPNDAVEFAVLKIPRFASLSDPFRPLLGNIKLIIKWIQ